MNGKKPTSTPEKVTKEEEGHATAVLSEKSSESQESNSQSKVVTRKGKPSRLPPPIPPPPELRPEAYFDALFMEYGQTDQLKQ